MVPMADLAGLLSPLRAELEAAFSRVLTRGHFVLGPELEALEASLAARLGVRRAIGVASGTSALSLALAALEVGPGDLVLTTPYSFVSSAAVIAAAGATPVFADVEPDTLQLDPSAARAWAEARPTLAAKVKVILPVHLFGACADVRPLRALAAELDAHLVEDAAQAIDAWLGTEGGRRYAGTFGDLGCLSFYPTKNLGGVGDGGAVLTDDEDLAARIERLRVPCAPAQGQASGTNARLGELAAAGLNVILPHVHGWTARRRAHAEAYDEALAQSGLQPLERGAGHVVHHYVLRAPGRREALRAHLFSRGVDSAIYYPAPLHRQGDFLERSLLTGRLDVAEAACTDALAVPVHPALSSQDHLHVAEALRSFEAEA